MTSVEVQTDKGLAIYSTANCKSHVSLHFTSWASWPIRSALDLKVDWSDRRSGKDQTDKGLAIRSTTCCWTYNHCFCSELHLRRWNSLAEIGWLRFSTVSDIIQWVIIIIFFSTDVQFQIVNNTPQSLATSSPPLQSGVWISPLSELIQANSSSIAVVRAKLVIPLD